MKLFVTSFIKVTYKYNYYSYSLNINNLIISLEWNHLRSCLFQCSATLLLLKVVYRLSVHSSNTIIKCADDTEVVRLISSGDERAHCNEIRRLLVVVQQTVWYWTPLRPRSWYKRDSTPAWLYINSKCAEQMKTFSFLGLLLPEDVSWSANREKGHIKLHFPKGPKRNDMDKRLLISVLTFCMLVCYTWCSASDKKKLQNMVRTSGKHNWLAPASFGGHLTGRTAVQRFRLTLHSNKVQLSVSVWSLHILSVSVWVYPQYSCLLSPQKHAV